MSIILFGHGYLGADFFYELKKQNIKVKHFHAPNSLRELLVLPISSNDVVINCAGYVGKPNVDACEKYKEETIRGNVLWPQLLTSLCYLHQIPLLHISTGCIYDGDNGGAGFSETDDPNFTFDIGGGSFYSGSKALAEKIVGAYERSWICRLRMPFDEENNPRNYLSKILNYNQLLNATNSITHKKEFILACIEIIKKNIPYGKYNIVNTNPITTQQITDLFTKIKGISGFKFFKNEREFYSSAAFARRSNCVLRNDKLLAAGIKMSDTLDIVASSIKKYKIQ